MAEELNRDDTEWLKKLVEDTIPDTELEKLADNFYRWELAFNKQEARLHGIEDSLLLAHNRLESLRVMKDVAWLGWYETSQASGEMGDVQVKDIESEGL